MSHLLQGKLLLNCVLTNDFGDSTHVPNFDRWYDSIGIWTVFQEKLFVGLDVFAGLHQGFWNI